MSGTIHDDSGMIAEIEAQAMADCHEQEREEIANRAAEAAASADAMRHQICRRSAAIAEDQRLERAAAFAASPRGRRILAARAA